MQITCHPSFCPPFLPPGAAVIASADAVEAMTVDLLFDFMAVRLNVPKADRRTMIIYSGFYIRPHPELGRVRLR